jgi:hypothetical protein
VTKVDAADVREAETSQSGVDNDLELVDQEMEGVVPVQNVKCFEINLPAGEQ